MAEYNGESIATCLRLSKALSLARKHGPKVAKQIVKARSRKK